MQFSSQATYTAKKRTPAPAGTHLLRCYGIIDLGTQTQNGQWGEKIQKKAQFLFELVGTQMPLDETDGVPKPFVISKEFTQSLGKKSALLPFTESWFARSLSEDEAKTGVPPQMYLGKECYGIIIQETKADGIVRSKLKAAMAVPQGTNVPPLQNPILLFSIGSPDQFNVFPQVYGWLRDAIIKSPEFQQECFKAGTTAIALHEQIKAQWKANNPLPQQGQPQSAMQPNQQWMQQGAQPMYNQQQFQPQQPAFQQQPAQPQYQPPVQPQYQQPPGYQQPQQYPQSTGFNQQHPQQQPVHQPIQPPAFGQPPVQPQQRSMEQPVQPAFGQPPVQQ